MNRSKITLAVCLAALIAVACSSGSQTQNSGNSNASGAPASGSSNPNAPPPPPAVAAPAPPPPPANANAAAADAKPAAPEKKDDAKSAAAKPAAAADGAALFAANKCSFCHGPDGKGNPKMKGVPDFTDAAWQKKEGDGELAATIKNGKKPMPPFGKTLSDNEIKALVAFVRGFAKK
jgi:mono/diheme cytochrome c family protein